MSIGKMGDYYKEKWLEAEAKLEEAKAIMQEWFNSENWDESYDHEILCRLDVVLNDRKMSSASELQIPRKEEYTPEDFHRDTKTKVTI